MTREQLEREYVKSYRKPDGCLRLIIIITMVVVIVPLIWIISRCERIQYQECWHCDVTTTYTRTENPKTITVVGTFDFCDADEDFIRQFEEHNTYSDSTMKQVTKCRTK